MSELFEAIAWVVACGAAVAIVYCMATHKMTENSGWRNIQGQPKSEKDCWPPGDHPEAWERIHTDQLNRIEKTVNRIEKLGDDAARYDWKVPPSNHIEMPCKKCGEPFSFTIECMGAGGPEK